MKKNIYKIEAEKALNTYLTEQSSRLAWETMGAFSRHVKLFLKWLKIQNLTIEQVDSKIVDKFSKALAEKGTCIETRWKVRNALQDFFEWLHQNDYPVKATNEILPYRKPRSDLIIVSLPKDACDFLDLIKVTMKPSTQNSDKTALRHLYTFIEKEKIDIKQISRMDAEKFFKYLLTKNQHPSTRLGITLIVRKYFRWLAGHKKIKKDPDLLVTNQDLPKLPDYLPRPIQPEMDKLIQTRFAESRDLCHRGLLLMRWTGLRVGELSNLQRDCVHKDFNGNSFLKVPLGKLNNERLVPLSEKILKLIISIKDQVDKEIKYKNITHLLVSPLGRQIPTHNLMFAFKEMTGDLKTPEPLVSHRLRHTYATELLGAGMNIFALKDILGHRSIMMTLRYAEVTQEKVRGEYFEALKRLENEEKYQSHILAKILPDHADYKQLLNDLLLELKKQIKDKDKNQSNYALILKRIKSLKSEIETILN